MTEFTAKLLLLLYLYSNFIVSASGQNQETCTGLDQLAQNANPSLLSGCTRDSGCTRVTCQAAGFLASYLGTLTITLRQDCETTPAIEMELRLPSGDAIIDQLITSPTQISHSISFATVSLDVFVNHSANSLGFAVDPATISAPFVGSSSAYLFSFTSIVLDLSGCQATTATPTTASDESTEQVLLTNLETCQGLEQLAMNANPNLLSNCQRDSACTQVTCEGNGILSGQVDSAVLVLSPCEMSPGVVVKLIQGGTALVDQFINSLTVIRHSVSLATIEVTVFINSTSNTVGISVDPFVVDAGFFGTTTDYLISFTLIPLDKSSCSTTTLPVSDTTTVGLDEETDTEAVSGISNAALPVSDTTTVGLDEETDTEADEVISTTTVTAPDTAAEDSTTTQTSTESDEVISTTTVTAPDTAAEDSTTTQTSTESVSFTNLETCQGLEQLAMNANPNFLSNCQRDSACTQVTCEGNGILSGQVDSAVLVLSPCEMPPGVVVKLIQGGTALVDQFINSSTIIRHSISLATIEVTVFVNSTSNTVGVLVDPFVIDAGFLRTTDYLISFTLIPLDKSSCSTTTLTVSDTTTVGLDEETDAEADVVVSTTTVTAPDTAAEDSTTTQTPTESDEVISTTTVTAPDTAAEDSTTTQTSTESVSFTNLETCQGLEQLAMNANPNFLSNCQRDSACTQVTCEGNGILSGQVDSAVLVLSPCEMPPGVVVKLIQGGTALVDQFINSSTIIRHSISLATIEVTVFVNSTSNTVGVLVDPFVIDAGFLRTTDYLISFTLIPLDKSSCSTTTLPVSDTTTVGLDEETDAEADVVVSTTTVTAPDTAAEDSTTTQTPTESDVAMSTTVAKDSTTTQSPTESGSSLDTCTGLQHLAMNTNPELLTDCTRDEACSMLTCQAAGIIASQLDTLALILKQCESPPGVTVQIIAKDGKAIVDQLVTKPTNISQTLASIARADAHVFVNSTDKTIGIAVDPVVISAGEQVLASPTLISFTVVPIDTSTCKTDEGGTSKVVSEQAKGAGSIPEIFHVLYLLPLIVQTVIRVMQ